MQAGHLLFHLRINHEKMEKITRMIHQMSWDLANADGRPRLHVVR